MRNPVFPVGLALLSLVAAGVASPVRAGTADDRSEIVNLMMHYGQVHDFGTPEEYAGLFTAQGEIVSGGRVLMKGHDAIVAQAGRDHERFAVKLPNGQTTFLMRHLISNTVVTALDGDHASGTSFVTTIIRDGEDGPKILSVGQYVDEYDREDGEWKIARRTIVMDLGNSELGRKYGFGS